MHALNIGSAGESEIEEMRATLTPEQQPKLDALVAKVHEHRRHALGLEGP